jgi:hypothetical protein
MRFDGKEWAWSNVMGNLDTTKNEWPEEDRITKKTTNVKDKKQSKGSNNGETIAADKQIKEPSKDKKHRFLQNKRLNEILILIDFDICRSGCFL